MGVKKEANGRRSVQVEVEVPGAPKEVWQAIATGPGVSAWFVPRLRDHAMAGSCAGDRSGVPGYGAGRPRPERRERRPTLAGGGRRPATRWRGGTHEPESIPSPG